MLKNFIIIINMPSVGRRFRWNKLLLIPVLIAGLLIWLLWPRGEAEAAWYNSSWAYRKAITITNNGSSQSNYTVEVIVDTKTLQNEGKLQTDCDDIIFTSSDGSTAQSYFVDYCSGTTGINSSFFVKVGSIAASGTTTIYMYYGNSGASSGASTYSTVGAPAGVWLGTGADGSVSISSDQNINTADLGSASRSCTDGGDAVNYASTANLAANGTAVFLATTPASGCLASGDEIMIINAKGTSGATADGLYEFARVISTNGTAVNINHGLVNAYNGTDRKVVVQRIPNYTSVTTSNSGTDLTASAWDGTTTFKGGILAFRANGTVTVNSSTTINISAKGYAGGAAGTSGANGGGGGESYIGNAGNGQSGAGAAPTSGGGESGDGTTASPNNGAVTNGGGAGGGSSGSSSSTNAAGGGGGGGYGYGGGGGGSGSDGTNSNSGAGGAAGTTSVNGGGGGGGRSGNGAGGDGGAAGSAGANTTGTGGQVGSGTTGASGGGGAGTNAGSGAGGGGGGSYGSASLSTLYFGSGGGGGGGSIVTPVAGTAGAAGGGIIYINASTMSVSGNIQANGGPGNPAAARYAGGGGAGAGGSILIKTINDTLGSSLVTANGGAAASNTGTDLTGAGAGGDGRIHVSYTDSGAPTTSPTANTAQVPYTGTPGTEQTQAQATATSLYWKFDEGYGTTTKETTGNLNTGTLAGTTIPTWQAEDRCVSGKCLYFDGTSSKVTLDSIFELKSVSLWVKPNLVTSAALIDLGNSVRITVSSGTISATGFTSPTIYVDGQVSSTLAANKWQHVAVTTGTTVSASSIVFGNYSTTYLKGFLDEVRMNSGTLTVGQVKSEASASGSSDGISARFGSSDEWISQGLVGYWRLNESTSPSVDYSGNNSNGTWSGNTAATAGVYGSAASFDGTDDYIGISDSSYFSIPTTNELTVAAWVRFDNVGIRQSVVSKGTGSDYEWEVRLQEDGSIRAHVYENSTGNTYLGGGSLGSATTGTWYHVVMTVNLNQQVLSGYFNGKLTYSSTSSSGTHSSGAADIRIGGRADGLNDLDGSIDEVRIYNRAFKPSEVAGLYNWAPGPVGYWPLDENAGTSSVNDMSGNGNTLTQNNAEASNWVPGKLGSGLFFNATGTGGGGNEGPSAIADSDNPALTTGIPGTVRQIVRTSGGTRYAFINDEGDSCEIWRSTDGNTWLEQDSADSPACVNPSEISAAIDNNNTIHLVYDTTGAIIRYNTFTTSDNQYGTAETVFDGDVAIDDLTIAVNSDNIPHIFFNETTNGSNDNYVKYSNRIGGSWNSPPITVHSDVGSGTPYGFPNIVINEDNIPEVAFKLSGVPETLVAGVADGTDPASFTTHTVENSPKTEGGMQLAVDGTGNTWIAYVDENGVNDYVGLIKHNDNDAWTTWQTPVNNTNVGNMPSITTANNIIYIFYQDENQDIVYDGYNGASWLGQALLHTGLYYDTSARWSYFNHPLSTQLDYIFSDYTDIFWATLSLSSADSDFLSRTDDTDFDFSQTDDFTVSAWVKLDGTASAIGHILTKADTTNGGYKLYMDPSGDFCFVTDDDTTWDTSDSACTSAIDYDDNKWHHVAGVKTGVSSLDLYVDGVLVATDSSLDDTNTLVNSGSLYAGVDSDGSSNMWTGIIDDIKIYNYARTPAQIIEDMNGGHPIGGSPIGSPVGYWRFDEGASNTCSGGVNDFCDNSINTNDLAYTGTGTGITLSGKLGIAFDGTGNNWASRADDSDFDFGRTDDMAITLWYKSDSPNNPGTTEYLVNKASSGASGYAIYANTSGQICYGIDDDNSWNPDVATCTTNDIYDNAWHHIAAIRHQSGSFDKTYLYIDGGLADSDTDTTNSSLANSLALYMADRDGTDNGDEFNGNIDELKIYRGILTSVQVLVDYNQGKAAVFGAISTDSSGNASHSSDRSYCIPGDTSTCNAPVGEWRLDENAGNTANDTSGNGNTSSAFTGAPVWVAAKFSSGLSFDGANSVVRIPETSVTDVGATSSSYTVSGWFRTSKNYTTEGFIVAKNSFAVSEYPFTIFMDPAEILCFEIADATHTITPCTTATYNDGKWHHVAGVRSVGADTISLYVDGARITSSTDTTTATAANNDDVSIGNGATSYTAQDFTGDIDLVRIYNYARTPAQIAWEYNRGQPVVWYKLDECTGGTAYNSIKNGNGDAAGNNGSITVGASGSNTSAGTCSSGTGTEAWNNGTSGKFNYSLDVDGTDDYIQITDPSDGSLDFNDRDFSIAGWFYRDSFTTDDTILAKRNGIANTDQGYMVYIDDSTDKLTFEVCDASSGCDEYQLESASAFTSTGWNHFVITWDDDLETNTEIYINGQADKATRTGTFGNIGDLSNALNLRVGTESDGTSGTFFGGQLDDIQIYGYALTPQQVKGVYTGGTVSFR